MKKLFLSVFLVIALSSSAQDFISGEFWVSFDIPAADFKPTPPSQEELIQQILGEMRYVFAGMIYGFSFSYVPSDVERSVEEEFDLKLMSKISAGDRNMIVYQTRMDSAKFYARAKYELEDFQKRWFNFWLSETFSVCGGIGGASFFEGKENRILAIKTAIKEAVRAHLRQELHNKPKKITGYVQLLEVPYIIIDAGKYVAKVRVRLDIQEVEDYITF